MNDLGIKWNNHNITQFETQFKTTKSRSTTPHTPDPDAFRARIEFMT